MKNWLTKLKNLTRGVAFFWQALIIIFFVALIIILIASAVFWFNLEQDLNLVTNADGAKTTGSIDARTVNLVLEQIKIRSAELTNPPANQSVVIDPSR